MMMTRTQYRSPQPKRKRPIIRTAVAWAIFFATMASTAFGVGREIYEARAKNFWQTLLIQGKLGNSHNHLEKICRLPANSLRAQLGPEMVAGASTGSSIKA